MNHQHECTGRRPDMISTLVIGGGIGGLSLARELAVRGLPVTVLEKAPQLNPVGAGIIMNPNAMRVLERNGLAEAVRLASWPYLVRETCDSRGRSLAMRDYRPLDRKSTRLNSSHLVISYAVFCLKKKKPRSNSRSAFATS